MVKDFVPARSAAAPGRAVFRVGPHRNRRRYKIQVVAKDFTSGQSASKTITYVVKRW
jgi:hypothetical protein